MRQGAAGASNTGLHRITAVFSSSSREGGGEVIAAQTFAQGSNICCRLDIRKGPPGHMVRTRGSKSTAKGKVVANELSPQRKPMAKAQAMFFKAFDRAKGDVGRLDASWGAIQLTMYATLGEQKGSDMATKLVLDGEGRANEGWTVRPGIFETIFFTDLVHFWKIIDRVHVTDVFSLGTLF